MRQYLDPYSGKAHRAYCFKGRPCNSVVVKSRKALKLSGYTLIEKDLRSCLSWLEEIEKRHDEPPQKNQIASYGRNRENYILIKGLFVSLITFYGKCYTSCEGRKVKLERSNLQSEFHGVHDYLMMLRHNFAAHSGSELIEQARVVIAYSFHKRSQKLYLQTYRELEQPDLATPKEGDATIRDLLLHARSIAESKISKLSDDVQNEEAKSLALKLAGS